MNKKEPRYSFLEKTTFLYLPIITAIYLLVALIGTIFNLSFCSSEGCQLAGEIMKISKPSMYSLGLFAICFAFLLGYFYTKTNKQFFKNLFGLLLYLMVCAESIFLGFMYFSYSGITCKICFIFYLLIILILILFYTTKNRDKSISQARLSKAINSFLTIITIIVALYLIKFDLQQKEFTPLKDGYSLIASQNCKYCKEIKTILKNKKIAFEILDLNEYKSIISFTGGKTIPVLILKNGNKIEIYNSFTSIKNYLNKSQNSDISLESILKPQDNSNPLFINNKKDDGCSIKTDEDCEK